MSGIEWCERSEGIAKINKLGERREAFLFILSYDKQKIFAHPLDSLDSDILYKVEECGNYPTDKCKRAYSFACYPLPFTKYQKAFQEILEEIKSGNTYLLNLTFKTPIETDLSLKEIFFYAQAKFKLYFKEQFVCFSPERFIDIKDQTLSTYPMKGTIEASIESAHETILANPKEAAEHVMIVDLMRNDLGIVGDSIKVEDFRYIEQIEAGSKELLQVSSKVTATLCEDWRDEIGTILDKLTPAGSITGTPKKSTRDIIRRVEEYERGFYTGVFGLFDGASLHSSVMIRFIEREDEKLYYKSGGGITIDSDPSSEYKEMINKIYLPFGSL